MVVSSLRSENSGACERVEVRLETAEGTPAPAMPPTKVEMPAGSGLVRIRFDPSATGTAVTDADLGGHLADRAYTVRGLDGQVFVDIHLASRVAARAFVREDGAALVIELLGLEGARRPFPKASEFVVVTGPASARLSYPLVVAGYSRTFEANVIAELVRPDGDREVLAVTSAADYIEMWGEFRLEIPEGPLGRVELFVGDYPPVDNAPPEGVVLEFTAA